jgi:5-methylcytosine-specific restriction endonuclease McrA
MTAFKTSDASRARGRAYYRANREKCLAAKRAKAVSAEEKARRSAYNRAYRIKNLTRLAALDHTPERRAYHLARYYANREACNARSRLYQKTHKAKCKALSDRWAKNNPQRMRELWRRSYSKVKERERSKRRTEAGLMADQRHRRRAKLKGLNHVHCQSKIRLLKLLPFCQYCVTLCVGKTTIDHIMPLTRGGEHVPENLIGCCSRCNCSKGNRTLSEWTWRPPFKEAA